MRADVRRVEAKALPNGLVIRWVARRVESGVLVVYQSHGRWTVVRNSPYCRQRLDQAAFSIRIAELVSHSKQIQEYTEEQMKTGEADGS